MNDNSKMIFDFTEKSNISDWKIVNDGVMGGVSTSSFQLNDQGNGQFEGQVSTENNGGFASVRYRFSSIDVNDSKFISIRLKGDSKDYQLRVKHNASDSESYKSVFSTSGNWETIKIKLSDLYPSFRGRKLDEPNFNASSFQEISFLIANKKNESFTLELDKIELVP